MLQYNGIKDVITAFADTPLSHSFLMGQSYIPIYFQNVINDQLKRQQERILLINLYSRMFCFIFIFEGCNECVKVFWETI